MSSDRGEIQPGAWKYANDASFGRSGSQLHTRVLPGSARLSPRQVHTERSKETAAVNPELDPLSGHRAEVRAARDGTGLGIQSRAWATAYQQTRSQTF